MTAPKAKSRKRSRAEQSTPAGPLTRVRKTVCRRCNRPILSGHVLGEPTRIDQTRINSTGELVALLRGSKTYLVSSRFDRVVQRRAYTITNDTPPKYGYVHAQHDCGMIWAAGHYDLRDLWPSDRSETCPF